MLENPAQFSVNRSADEVVIIATGEIDALSEPDFASVVHELVTTDSELVIDLTAVTFMDSSGLTVLAAAAKKRDAESQIRIRGASAMIRRLLALTGLDGVVTLEPSTAGNQPDAA